MTRLAALLALIAAAIAPLAHAQTSAPPPPEKLDVLLDWYVNPDHAPLITTLRPGILTVVTAEGATDYAVTGGFAEIGAEGVSVLAERAHVTHEVTQAMIDEMIAAAQKAHKEAHPDVVDSAAKLLSDLVAMGSRIGLEPKLS